KIDWHAVVGSLWFDARSGQLVRAAYRLSDPRDLLDDGKNNSGFVARAILEPSSFAVTGIAIEYGLYQGRFWLPRSQVGEGNVRMGFVRVPLRIEERFAYASINSADSIAVI